MSTLAVALAPFAAAALGLRLARARERRAAGRRTAVPFLLRRLAWLVLTAEAVFTLTFFLVRAVPGGPFEEERALAPEVRAQLDALYGLDRPVAEQYVRALAGLAVLDFGPSLTLRDLRVSEIVAQGLPPSFLLGAAAAAWMLLLGLPAGILSALRRGTAVDSALGALLALGLAVPNFVLAGILLIPLSFGLGLLPAAGFESVRSLVLPSFCLGAPFAAHVARLTRTGLLEVLGQDWVRTARAKGLPERRVVLGHALRGAIVPVVVSLGPALAGILTGSLVIEQMFAIPGLGTHFVQSALSRDYTLALGLVMLFTVVVYVLNALTDLAQAALDPRVVPS